MALKFLLAVSVATAVVSAAVATCPAGMPVGAIDLMVRHSPDTKPLPMRSINRVEEGDQILYAPVLHPKEKRQGQVAIVLIPANAAERKEESLRVLKPKPADRAEQWNVPFRSSLAVFVYGPSGLNTNKVRNFLAKDDELVSQLADYAEKTAQTEQLLQQLASIAETNPSDNLNAALQGFAGQSGISKLDRTQPGDLQGLTVLHNLTPTLPTYDPIMPQGPQRLGQTASLMTAVAGMFFGNTVGLAAGGAAMALTMKTLLFPDAEFRSSYAQPAKNDAVALCGKRDPSHGHTRVAYLWAMRIPDAKPPAVSMDGAQTLAAGLKSAVQVHMPDPEWKLIDRAHNWALKSADGKTTPVAVDSKASDHALEVDLSRVKPAPGKYELQANWDWDHFSVLGDVDVRPLSSFAGAHVTPASQNLLLQHSGKRIVQIEGDDFEFVSKVALVRKGDKYSQPVSIPFSLPVGLHRGVQDRLEMEIDTATLDAGNYSLLLMQQDGATKPVNLQILDQQPLVNLPVQLNARESDQLITLQGNHLDRIQKLAAHGLTFDLGASIPGAQERDARVHVPADLPDNAKLDLIVQVQDFAQPLTYPDAIQVAVHRPRILESKLAVPADLEIALEPGELPAGVYVSAMVQARNFNADASVELACRNLMAPKLTVGLGSEKNGVKLRSVTADSLFLSFDPATWPSGCNLSAAVQLPGNGRSDWFLLGHVIRLPRIEAFKLTDESAGNGGYFGVLTGHDLEVIEKTGWDANHGIPVPAIPTPIAGEGSKQSLKIQVPWPSPAPHSPLYVWFRGEKDGRATTVRY